MRSTDAGFVSALMLLDLSAAFETVNHAILLEVLTERFGVENLELDWFRSYHANFDNSKLQLGSSCAYL